MQGRFSASMGYSSFPKFSFEIRLKYTTVTVGVAGVNVVWSWRMGVVTPLCCYTFQRKCQTIQYRSMRPLVASLLSFYVNRQYYGGAPACYWTLRNDANP